MTQIRNGVNYLIALAVAIIVLSNTAFAQQQSLGDRIKPEDRSKVINGQKVQIDKLNKQVADLNQRIQSGQCAKDAAEASKKAGVPVDPCKAQAAVLEHRAHKLGVVDIEVAHTVGHMTDSQLIYLSGGIPSYDQRAGEQQGRSKGRGDTTHTPSMGEQVGAVVSPQQPQQPQMQPYSVCPEGTYPVGETVEAQGGNARNGEAFFARRKPGCMPIPGWQPRPNYQQQSNAQPVPMSVPPAAMPPTSDNSSSGGSSSSNSPSKRSTTGWLLSGLLGGGGGAALGCGAGGFAMPSELDTTSSRFSNSGCGYGALIGTPIGAALGMGIYALATR